MLKLLLEIAPPNELRSLFLMLNLPRQDASVAGWAEAEPALAADARRWMAVLGEVRQRTPGG